MDDIELLIDLHLPNARQGPGGAEQTRLALALSGLAGRSGLRIADIGCGTGATTLVLAEALDARIDAVDLAPPFVEALRRRAAEAGLADRVTASVGAMESLPFKPGSLDAIWSEGAIYSMGFAAGVAAWRPFLKPGGILAVSELTWLTAERPAELTEHWQAAYPEVGTASEKMAVLEHAGYSPVGYFVLPETCWLDDYYRPLQARFPAFLDAHGHSAAARAIVAEEEKEIDLYERHSAFVSYGFYVARRAADGPA